MDFEVGGQQYRLTKLDTFKQLHVSRRLVPVMTGDGATFEISVALGIARMPDADCDYILHECLSVVKRQQGDKWAPVYEPHSRSLMFTDIDLGVMLKITTEVVKDNLAGFFSEAVAKLTATPTTA